MGMVPIIGVKAERVGFDDAGGFGMSASLCGYRSGVSLVFEA